MRGSKVQPDGRPGWVDRNSVGPNFTISLKIVARRPMPDAVCIGKAWPFSNYCNIFRRKPRNRRLLPEMSVQKGWFWAGWNSGLIFRRFWTKDHQIWCTSSHVQEWLQFACRFPIQDSPEIFCGQVAKLSENVMFWCRQFFRRGDWRDRASKFLTPGRQGKVSCFMHIVSENDMIRRWQFTT